MTVFSLLQSTTSLAAVLFAKTIRGASYVDNA
jgi:hypothetical protein